MKKSIIDYIIAWQKYYRLNAKFWLATTLLALSLALVIQQTTIKSAYLDPTFAGLSQSTPIANVVLINEGRAQAIEPHLADEIITKWPVIVSYERTTELKLSQGSSSTTLPVSFFGEGYNALGIHAYLGDLTALDEAQQGETLVAAVTFDYWQKKLDSKQNIIGTTLNLSNQLVTIKAVLPAKFKGWMHNQPVDVVLPYRQQVSFFPTRQGDILPDVNSYLIGSKTTLAQIQQYATDYLSEQAYLFEQQSIELNKAIGIEKNSYYQVEQKLLLLSWLFNLLLLFCVLAFLAYISAEFQQKQQEITVRKLCGASKHDINLQKVIELLLTLTVINTLTLVLLPIVKQLFSLLLPQASSNFLSLSLTSIVSGLVIATLVLMFAMALLLWLQEKVIRSNVGRGASASLSEKVQVYTLTSLLVNLGVVSIICAALIISNQWQLYQQDLGFSTKNRYVASFAYNTDIFSKPHSGAKTPKLLVNLLEQQTIINNAAITNTPPFMQINQFKKLFTAEGVAIGTGKSSNTPSNAVSPSYFDTLNIELIQGRTLGADNPFEVVVNQALWQQYFSGYSLGQASLMSYSTTGDKINYPIVGIASNTRLKGAEQAQPPTVYGQLWALIGFESVIVETTTNDEQQIRTVINNVTANVDATLGELNLESLQALKARDNAPRLAIMALTLVTSVIISLSAFLYALTSIKQLSNKLARELSVKFNLGAQLKQLFVAEYRYFASFTLLTLALLVAGFHLLIVLGFVSETVMTENIYGLISIAFIATNLCTALLLWRNVKQKIQHSWTYLTS